MDDQARQDQIRKLNVRISDDEPGDLHERIDEIISQEREKVSQMDRGEGDEAPFLSYPEEDRRKSRMKGLNVSLSDDVRTPAENLDQTISDERQRVYEAGRSEEKDTEFPEEIRRSEIRKAGAKLKDDPDRVPTEAADALISSGRNEAYEAARQKKDAVSENEPAEKE